MVQCEVYCEKGRSIMLDTILHPELLGFDEFVQWLKLRIGLQSATSWEPGRTLTKSPLGMEDILERLPSFVEEIPPPPEACPLDLVFWKNSDL